MRLRSRPNLRLCLTVVMSAACSAEPTRQSDAVITASSDSAWSGGEVDLTSTAFTGADSLPRVMLATHLLAVTRLGPSSVRVLLPDTTGSFTLRVTFHDGRTQDAATVTLGGGLSHWFQGAPLSGNPVRIPGTTRLLGNGEHGLVWFDVPTGTASAALPDSAHEPACAYSPGLSTVPGIVIGVRHPNPPAPFGVCKTYAWQIEPTLAVVDSTPAYGAWALAHAGNGRWVVGGKHFTYRCTPLGCPASRQSEEPEEFAISPDGSRVFPVLAWDFTTATAVYDATSDTIAYELPQLRHINGVGFSANGDTAFVAGLAPGSTDTVFLYAINSRTGSVFREGRLPGGYPELMAVDPDHPWLYMVDIARPPYLYGRPVIRVIDRHELRQVAILRGPAGTPPITNNLVMLPVISPSERRIYVVGLNNWTPPATNPSDVFVFALLP